MRLETRFSDEFEAEVLAITPGKSVHISEGVGMSDGVPVTLSRSIFPADAMPGLLDGLRDTGSVTQALAISGVPDYTREWTRITAERANATQAGHLHCPEGVALLRTHSLNVDGSGQPVEYGETWFVGDRIELVVEPG